MTNAVDTPAVPVTSPSRPATQFPSLTAADRCDGVFTRDVDNRKVTASCGAQAFVRAVFPSGSSLTFCKHDGTKYEAALIAAGATILDEAAQINTKPTDPSRHNV